MDDSIAGPGSYKVPGIIGNKPVQSSISSCPKYSFFKQNYRENKLRPINLKKKSNRHNLSQSIPGVGQYNPNKLNVIRKLPTIALTKAQRFASTSKLMSFRDNM